MEASIVGLESSSCSCIQENGSREPTGRVGTGPKKLPSVQEVMRIMTACPDRSDFSSISLAGVVSVDSEDGDLELQNGGQHRRA